LDIFAWQPSDMTGVPRSIAEHRLNIREGYSPVRQKKRGHAPERAKAIQAEVGQNMEVYVDDLVIKSHTEAEMLRDIDETFRFMISPEGIKPCPDKTEAVLQLSSLRTIKEVQSLNGKLASLNRFLSKSAEKSLPLFKTLKKYIKKSDFHWTPEVEQAFKQLKQHLSELPLLAAPKPKEELIVYLSASHRAISAVLITERGMVQTPVYFVSRSLQGLELNYTPIEKLVLSLVFAAKRLQRYFQAHPEGTEFTYALRFQFTASNNEEEYEALIVGLRIAVQMEVRNVHAIIPKAVAKVKKFMWDNIVCRFGLPGEIVSDNAIREAKAKLKMTKYYNARVRSVTFRPGDFVYRINDASHTVDEGKIGPKWEGPYEVTEALGDGAYRLRSMDGTVLSRT
ncbi:reverse transcriptase domain-containing protein, partial [Tanacetum coccineum]